MTSFFGSLLGPGAEEEPAPRSVLEQWRSFSAGSPAAARLAGLGGGGDPSQPQSQQQAQAQAQEQAAPARGSDLESGLAGFASSLSSSFASLTASAASLTADDLRASAAERARLVGARLEGGASHAAAGLKGGAAQAAASLKSAAQAARDAGGDALSSLQALNPDRLMTFVLLAAAAAFLLALAFVVGLPLAPLSPAKFAIPFTLGSVCNLGALAALRGPKQQLAHMLAHGRAPLSLAYGASVVATLWAALVARSYVLTVATCGAQLVAMLTFTVSHFPGGVPGARLVFATVYRLARPAAAAAWVAVSQAASLCMG